METGDIVLYTASKTPTRWWIFDAFISLFTVSEWVHVGFVIKDPEWLDLKGVYLFESTWASVPDSAEHRKLFGVQIVPLDERINEGSTYYRKYNGTPICHKRLQEVYQDVKDKPYDVDPWDWVKAFLGLKTHPQRENSFWCSALVACVLTKVGILPSDTDWSIFEPKMFGGGFHPAYGPIKNLTRL
jgi:hypothetical protein